MSIFIALQFFCIDTVPPIVYTLPMKATSNHAAAAKAIRSELKKAFPGQKFSVTSTSYSGGDSVRVSWVDGPLMDQVDSIAGKYQYGSFDGMTDSYNVDNSIKDLPQVRFVQVERTMSDESRSFFEKCAEYLFPEERKDVFAHRLFHEPSGALCRRLI
mgnify:CR=1 FL=1